MLVGGGGAYWWLSRETPEKVLRDGFNGLIGMKTVKTMRFDVATTAPKSNATSRFTLIGEADVSDLIHPKTLGVLRIGAKSVTDMDQTVDVVADGSRVALRPRFVKPEYQALAARLASDSVGVPFLSIDLVPFLQHVGFDAAVSTAKSADLRSIIPSGMATMAPTEALSYSDDQGRRLVSSPFRVDRRAMQPFLIALVKAWTKRTPTAKDQAWIDRVSDGLGQGRFVMTVDRSTREPVELSGSWPVVDNDGRVLQRLRVTLALDGINQPVSITIPEGTLDVTSSIVKTAERSLLPTSATSTTSFPMPTTTESGASSPGTANIDAFDKYFDELKRKKNY